MEFQVQLSSVTHPRNTTTFFGNRPTFFFSVCFIIICHPQLLMVMVMLMLTQQAQAQTHHHHHLKKVLFLPYLLQLVSQSPNLKWDQRKKELGFTQFVKKKKEKTRDFSRRHVETRKQCNAMQCNGSILNMYKLLNWFKGRNELENCLCFMHSFIHSFIHSRIQ